MCIWQVWDRISRVLDNFFQPSPSQGINADFFFNKKSKTDGYGSVRSFLDFYDT
jgi:hypothetical protein